MPYITLTFHRRMLTSACITSNIALSLDNRCQGFLEAIKYTLNPKKETYNRTKILGGNDAKDDYHNFIWSSA